MNYQHQVMISSISRYSKSNFIQEITNKREPNNYLFNFVEINPQIIDNGKCETF